MPKRAATIATLLVSLDEKASAPLYRQLYEGVRDAVLSGVLVPGTRLPASRTLVDDLGVARNTVLIAFEQLFAEGYVECKVGAGTYVCRALPDHHSQIQTPLRASRGDDRLRLNLDVVVKPRPRLPCRSSGPARGRRTFRPSSH